MTERHGDDRDSMTAYLLLESIFCECSEKEDGICVCGWDD